MRWLVTGGLGFIGSHFIRLALLAQDDIEITNLDAMTYAGNPANCADIENSPRYSFVRADICDESAVESAIGAGVDAVINFAAETHVDRSILEPGSFLRTDIMGTHVLLEAVRRHRVRRFLQVSTDEVYGDVTDGESREEDPLRPRSPYSASKAGADLQTLAYWHTYGTPVLITRGSNTFGPYQYPEKLMPLFITNLIDDEPVPVYGDGLQERDWLYVEDHVRGILQVLESGTCGEVYNLGGDSSFSNLEITRQLVDACGRTMGTHVRHISDREGHDRRYCLDSQKAHSLGWAPRVTFDAGLQQTVQWYRQNEAWWRPLKSGQFVEYYRRQYAHR
jgi:dTDP-glucose 4,6-dehydratase